MGSATISKNIKTVSVFEFPWRVPLNAPYIHWKLLNFKSMFSALWRRVVLKDTNVSGVHAASISQTGTPRLESSQPWNLASYLIAH